MFAVLAVLVFSLNSYNLFAAAELHREIRLAQDNSAAFEKLVAYANNSDISLENRSLAFVEIGDRYATGKGLPQKDVDKALFWYEKALNQEVSQRAKAKANYNIGVLYASGSRALPKDLKIARTFFERAVDQNASVGSKEFGLYELAHIDEFEGNLVKAKLAMHALIESATLPIVKELAQSKIIEIAQKLDAIGRSSSLCGYELRTAPAGVPYQLHRDEKLKIHLGRWVQN